MAITLPPGFREVRAATGHFRPTVARFAKNGQLFVAEKSGLVWAYDGLDDPTATLVADLTEHVHNFWDRGLLGLAISPTYPDDGRIYVFYTHNVDANNVGPRWTDGDPVADPCPTPPGATEDGCVVYGRLSRIDIDTTTMEGAEVPLIQGNWCQQFPSHSVGDLIFDEDGFLYASSGDGANFNYADYGQDGDPVNPCDDPPDGIGGPNDGPDAEGGSLRSQDILTPGDPTAFNGSVLRIDVSTGVPRIPQDNPLITNGVPDDDLIVATGLRNPFRMKIRPGTNEVWIADVGSSGWEEINVVPAPGAPVENFGWPCYEGGNGVNAIHGGFETRDLCNLLFDNRLPGGIERAVPFYAYSQEFEVVPGDGCGIGGSALTGLVFYDGGSFPAEYRDALFFGDSTRRCLWTMPADEQGLPDKDNITVFAKATGRIVDLQIGSDGGLYYLDYDGGHLFRIEYTTENIPPTAVMEAEPAAGPAPLLVQFDAGSSFDPEDGSDIDFEWDLDADGEYDDSVVVSPSWTYVSEGRYTPGLRVTDTQGKVDEVTVVITAGNTPPRPVILQPVASHLWKVGELVTFSGEAMDDEDGALPAEQFSWDLVLHHCATLTDCHTHDVTTFDGVTSGSFVTPDHTFPSFLELRLNVSDLSEHSLSGTASVRLDARTVSITMTSDPEGLAVTLGTSTETTPFQTEVIVGSKQSVDAPVQQTVGNQAYRFVSWSDGGNASHNIVAGETGETLAAMYELSPPAEDPVPPNGSSGSGGNGPFLLLWFLAMILCRRVRKS